MSLRDQLQTLYSQHGELTPELVVQVARPEDHPLHDRVFDKPVEDAAESYYRRRAHDLIQSVRVVYKEADESGPEKSVRVFHAVQREQGYVYEPIEQIAGDPFVQKMLLTTLEREWRSLYDRAQHVGEFFDLVAADLKKTRRKAA